VQGVGVVLGTRPGHVQEERRGKRNKEGGVLLGFAKKRRKEREYMGK
jgi:hypothetical protein